MFNGYNEAPLIYNDFEHERGRKQQNAGKWPYGHGTGIQSHPPNQAEFWSPKAGPFLKFPSVLPIPSKCTCTGCYSSGENPSGVQGDAARHRPWFHRPATIPSNGSEDPSKLVGAHLWENVNLSNLPQEKSCSVGDGLNPSSHYLQENGEKSSFHRPYVCGRHPEPHQPGVITSAKSAETSRKEETSKRPEEIITSPSGQEILLLGQREGGYSASSNHAKKDPLDPKEKYYNPENPTRQGNAASFSSDQTGRLHHSGVEPYGKPVPFNPTQNRVPSIGHVTFKDNVPESYLDPKYHDSGKSIRSNHQAQSFPEDKNCRNAFQTPDSALSESKMEPVQNGHVKPVPSVYGNYLDYANYGLKRDFPMACNPVGGSESQKLQYYNNKKNEYLARNYFPDAMRKTGSSLYEESKRDCMVSANSVVGIHEQYLGALGRSNHGIPKYWESGNPKVSSCGIYYPKDSGGTAEKRSRGGDSFDCSQKTDSGLKKDFSNANFSRVPPHPSIYPSDPSDVRYPEKEYAPPFHYQNTSSSAYKNLRKAEYAAYARYNHQAHYEYSHGGNAFQIPELGNPNQYNLKAYQNSAPIEQYLPHLGGGGGGGSGGNSVFEPQLQQIASASAKHYAQSFYDPSNFQPVLHSATSAARANLQAQQIFANDPACQAGRSEESCRTGPNKISPLRLLRKKKSAETKNEPEKGTFDPGLRNPNPDEGAPALDVRRFWATWAEEEDDNPPQTQMVVLDCRDIDPEQAELLRLYDADPGRAIQVEGTQVLPVKNQVEEQRLELGGNPVESETDRNGNGCDKPATAVENVPLDARVVVASASAVVDGDSSGEIKVPEETGEDSVDLVKIGPDSIPFSTEELARVPPVPNGHSKPPKKCFNGKAKKSAAASEEVMDKWTEKKFDFLKRAEESKAAELARSEQEKMKILEGKKSYKDVALISKAASASKNLFRDADSSPSVVPGKTDSSAVPFSEKSAKDEDRHSPSGMHRRIDAEKSPDSEEKDDDDDDNDDNDDHSEHLPTSEYRKNKFLDYSKSEDVLRLCQVDSKPAGELSEKAFENGVARSEKIEKSPPPPSPSAKATTETLLNPGISDSVETNRACVPLEEMNEIFEKISRISFDGPDSSSDKSRDSVKSDKTKKLKKTGKKCKKPNHQDPKIKFSIQKFQDLKISFKIHNELAENPERGIGDSELEKPPVPNMRKNGRLKKRKIRAKTPVVTIKEIACPDEESLRTEKEGEKSPRILDLSKHRIPSCDGDHFRVQESFDSAKIKLTIKRNRSEFLKDGATFALPGDSEWEDAGKREAEPSEILAEESSSINVESEKVFADESGRSIRETSAEGEAEKERLPVRSDQVPVIIQNEIRSEKRKTVIRHSLDENAVTSNSEEERKDSRSEEGREIQISSREKNETDDPEVRRTSEEIGEKDSRLSEESDRKRRADRDSIETRLSEMFGHDSGDDGPKSPGKKDSGDVASESVSDPQDPVSEKENVDGGKENLTENEKVELGKELGGSEVEDPEGTLPVVESEETEESKYETFYENAEIVYVDDEKDSRETKEKITVKEASEKVNFRVDRSPDKETETSEPENISAILPDLFLSSEDSKLSVKENAKKISGGLGRKGGRCRSLSPGRVVYFVFNKAKSLPPSTKLGRKENETKAENFTEVTVCDIPLPDGDPPEENVFDFRELARKREAETAAEDPPPLKVTESDPKAETETETETVGKMPDEDDSLRFPLPSPTFSDESSRSESESEFSREKTCRSPFVLSGFDKFRNPSPPWEKENFGGEEEEKKEAGRIWKRPRVDSARKSDNLRNPSPPSSNFGSDSPLSTVFKSDSEDFFPSTEDGDGRGTERGEKPEESEEPGRIRDERIRTPSPLRPENVIVYGTDCPLSKESIEEGTRLSDSAPSEKDVGDAGEIGEPRILVGEEPEDGRESFDEVLFRAEPIDSEDAIFVTDEFYQLENQVTETNFSHPFPVVDESEEDKVSDDKFHDVMQNCLENAKKFLGSKPDSCSAENPPKTIGPETEDVVSLEVSSTTWEEMGGEAELGPDENFPCSDVAEELLARDLCPEFLPVDNWPYLEEEVPMSPAGSRAEGSEISSPPLEDAPSLENPVRLFDPSKNFPDARNLVSVYLDDEKGISVIRPVGGEIPGNETKKDPSESALGLNGFRRKSLASEPGSISDFSASSVRRRKTVDGIAGNYAARRKVSEDPETENDLKCRLSLERLSSKKKERAKEMIKKGEGKTREHNSKGNLKITEPLEKEYLSREWQPKVILSRISDRELREKRRSKVVDAKRKPSILGRVDRVSCETEIGKESDKYSAEKENPFSDDIKKERKISDEASPVGNGTEAEEKTRKKPRFRNLHSKKERTSEEKNPLFGRNECPTDSETESDEAGPPESLPTNRSDVPKRKPIEGTLEKLRIKKKDVSLGSFPEKKEDKKWQWKTHSDAYKSSNRSGSRENPTPESCHGSKRKKPSWKNSSTDLKTEKRSGGIGTKKRKPEQAPQVSSSCWICEVCGFSDETQRSPHIKTHAFHCQSCHLAFKTERDFTEHLIEKHKDIKNQHHCLLCELSFEREEEHRKHLESREHKHLESVEKNTINTLFTLLTGQACPVLGPVELKPEWLPTQAGTVHFYHQATPLSLALQYLKMRHDSCSSQPK